MTDAVDLAEAIEGTPGSIRELARESGRSEALLRHVRDGRRRLTGETRAAVVGALRRWADRCDAAAGALDGSAAPEPRERRLRYLSEIRRAERYAADEMGWRNAEAVEARAAGRDGRAVAVLIDPGVQSGGPGRFVIAFDEADRLATDAGDPAEFGFGEA